MIAKIPQIINEVAAILAAYALATFGVLPTTSFIYLALNLTGAIVTEAATKRDVQPVVLNLIWAIVALVGIIRALT